MGFLYTTAESVKLRLVNKVQFQSGTTPIDGELPNDLLCQIIQDAETDVEMELRSRYAVPFRSIARGTFEALPDHTKRVIRKAVDYRAVVLILGTDFGRGTAIAGEPYYKAMMDFFTDAIQKAMGRDVIGKNDKIDRHKVSPPLDDLMLAKTNKKADDGYRGTVINTDARESAVEYAENQLDDPSTSWIRSRIGGL